MTIGHVNSTRLYDAATASTTATGMKDLETRSDNPSVAPNSLSLASYWGDTFDQTDADGDTWKWTPDVVLDATTDINTTITGMYAIDMTAATVLSVSNAGSAVSLTDIRATLVNMDALDYSVLATDQYLLLEAYNGGDDGYNIKAGWWNDGTAWFAYLSVNENGSPSSGGTVVELHSYLGGDNIFAQFRLVSDGALGYAYYRVGNQDITSNENWTLLNSGTMTGVLTKARFNASMDAAWLYGIDDFVAYGSGLGTWVATSGTWTTPIIQANASSVINIIFNVADLDANNYIKTLDIYDNSDLVTPITSWNSGSIVSNMIMETSDFDNNLYPCTGTAIVMKITFVGDGLKRPSISTLSIVYDDETTSEIAWGSDYMNVQGAQ
jgi:hypothetical protein